MVLTQEEVGGSGNYFWIDIHPSDSGIVSVFTIRDDMLDSEWNVLAKRANLDGTLGGPNATIEDVTTTIEDNNAVLTWSSYADSANYYLRFADNPYSFPAEPDTTISDTVFTDVDAVLEGMKFYDVRWQPLE